ncbi:MAG: FAD-binding protein, partial [Pseudomonadota bacterium]|nr:FAD-binding protein [Pseudomonadota bacterium]
VGFGSNLLIRDGGVDGVVIVLGKSFSRIEFDGELITAGAAALDVQVARSAQQAGVAGLEFLAGIPGSIGGAVRMNAGAYGSEIGDVIINATVLDEQGGAHVLDANQLELGYRQSGLKDDWIVLSARLRGEVGDRDEIAGRMAAISTARIESQP